MFKGSSGDNPVQGRAGVENSVDKQEARLQPGSSFYTQARTYVYMHTQTSTHTLSECHWFENIILCALETSI